MGFEGWFGKKSFMSDGHRIITVPQYPMHYINKKKYYESN